jgi:hypothetical protein
LVFGDVTASAIAVRCVLGPPAEEETLQLYAGAELE